MDVFLDKFTKLNKLNKSLIFHVKELIYDLADGIDSSVPTDTTKKKKKGEQSLLSLDNIPVRNVGISESQVKRKKKKEKRKKKKEKVKW